MTLVRWRPMGDMVSMQDEMNRTLEDLWRRALTRSGAGAGWIPPVDLLENENEFKLVAELPGMSRDDVKISLTDNILTLRGEKKAQSEETEQNWHHVERSYGTFERTFHLTNAVDASKVKAKFDNGVLTVQLPKVEEARPREIRIDN
jgi:HSP20 family protein